MRYCARCDNSRWVCENHPGLPFWVTIPATAAELALLARPATKPIPRIRMTFLQCHRALLPNGISALYSPVRARYSST
jgi:hypothetical protein